MLRIGLLSDTHGLLRPEARAFLRGSDRIIHAGDVCDPAILEDLVSMAPLTVVRGNCDRGTWAMGLRETELLEVEGVRILVCHDLSCLGVDPRQAGVRVVVSGHSHKPLVEERGEVLYINPGSAGPRRFRLPVSIGELLLEQATVSARLQELALS